MDAAGTTLMRPGVVEWAWAGPESAWALAEEGAVRLGLGRAERAELVEQEPPGDVGCVLR